MGMYWRDDRRDGRWEAGRHNGYWRGNGWHFGPPQTNDYRARGFSLGYRPWRVDDRLGYFGSRYAEVDYRRHDLQRPRRGYHGVRDNRGVYLLAGIRSGVIIQVLNRNTR